MIKIRSREDIERHLVLVEATMERSTDGEEIKEIEKTIEIVKKFLETGTLPFNVKVDDKFLI